MSGMWMAAALVAAMTSTVSAQAGVKGTALGSGPAAPESGAAASAGSGGAPTALDVQLSGEQITGWCGTDVTKPLQMHEQRARIQLASLAMLLHSVGQFLPTQALTRLVAYRLWLQSSIDVLPPF